MRQLFSKADVRDLSLIVAVVMLLASIPANPGVVVVSGPSRPELTVNICQPIQMLDRESNTLLERPATVFPGFILRHRAPSGLKETVWLVERKAAPDTPPPKRPA